MARPKSKKAARADGCLSQEELAKAIAEYKAKYGTKSDGDEEKLGDEVVKTSPAPDMPGEEKKDEDTFPKDEETPAALEEQVQAVKERHEDDEDVQLLCNIIDTLLAQKAFDESDDEKDETNSDDTDELETLKGDSDDEDDELNKDEDDEDKEEKLDSDDDEDENCDSEDEDTEPGQNTELKTLNTDSIDRIVRERVKLGMIGRKVNLDGLEDLSIKAAKKAIIRAVRPGVRLDGKSDAYINAMYDCAVDDINHRSQDSTQRQKKQLFNKDSASDKPVSAKLESSAARERMIARQRKNNKEE